MKDLGRPRPLEPVEGPGPAFLAKGLLRTDMARGGWDVRGPGGAWNAVGNNVVEMRGPGCGGHVNIQEE